MNSRTRRPSPEPTPLWFKAWFAFCALLGVGLLGLIAWAIVRLVTHYT